MLQGKFLSFLLYVYNRFLIFAALWRRQESGNNGIVFPEMHGKCIFYMSMLKDMKKSFAVPLFLPGIQGKKSSPYIQIFQGLCIVQEVGSHVAVILLGFPLPYPLV